MSRDLNLTITDDNGNPIWATFIFSQTGQKYTFTDIYDIGGKHFRLGLSHPTEGKNAGKYIISRENSADEIFDSMDDVNNYIKSEYKFEAAKLSDLYVDNKPLVSKEINETSDIFDKKNKQMQSDFEQSDSEMQMLKTEILEANPDFSNEQLENVGFKYSVAAKAWKSEMTKENLSGLLTIIKKSYPSDFEHCKKEAEDIFLGKTEEKKPEVKKEKETLIDYSGMENTCANFIKNIRYVNSAFPQYKGNLAHILSDIIKSASTEERIGMLAIFKGCKNKDELNKTLQEIVYRPEEINQNKNVKLDMSKKQSVEQSDKDTLGR